jgi:UDP-glucose 4-epimerase
MKLLEEHMKVLITGCAGLIGSRLAEYILKNKPGVTVIGVDDLSGGYAENVPEGVIFYRYDIANKPESIDRIFETNEIDIVYHFAAYAAECVSPFIRRFNYINNLVGTASIINASIKYGVKRLVFTSSMAVYGDSTPPFNEDMVRNPVDPYGVAKAAAERDIEIAGEQHGLDWCIIRPHNVYGRNQNIWDSYRNFGGIAIYKGLVGDPITVYGDGLQTRAFSEMTDSLEPLWIAGVDAKASRQIINLGGIKETTILEVAEIVKELSGVNIIHLPPRHEVRHAYPTYQKSVEILGFEHKTDIYEGIKNMWEWAKTQPKRERFIWKEYELEKGLYEYWKPEALKDGYWKMPVHV